MPDLSNYQKDICIVPPKPEPLLKICPTCIPNKGYMEPDWTKMLGDTYLNEKSCEYMVSVTMNNEAKSFKAADLRNYPPGRQRQRFLRTFVQPAIVMMLEDYGKLVADQIICATFPSETLSGLSTIEMLSTYSDFTLAYNLIKNDPQPMRKKCIPLDVPQDDLPDVIVPDTPIDPAVLIANVKGRLPEVTNPYALELYAHVKDYYIDPVQNLLKVLVAVPAYIFEKTPDNLTADEIEESAQQTRNEVVLNVKELFGQKQRLKKAMRVFGTYQAFFHKTREGHLYWREGEDKRDFYAKNEAKRVQGFYVQLKQLCKDNDWNIRSSSKSVARQNARLIKIDFYEQNEKNPYKIKSIKVKKKGCPYVKITKGITKFKKKWNKFPTTVNYYAKMKQVDIALRARKSYPWLDFCVKFTYPLLIVDYGSMDLKKVEQTVGSCIANNAKDYLVDLKNYIFDEVLSFKDVLAFQYNMKGCTEFGNKEDRFQEEEFPMFEIDTVDQMGPGREAKLETQESETAANEEKYEQWDSDLASLREINEQLRIDTENIKSSATWLIGGTDPVKLAMIAQVNSNRKRITENNERLEEIQNNLRNFKKVKRKDKRAAKKSGRQAARGARKDRRKNIRKNAAQAALAEFLSQDTMLTQIVDLETFLTGGGLNFNNFFGRNKEIDMKDLFERLTLCNLQNMVLGSVKCLFSGVALDAALRRIIKTALEAMDIDVFGFFIQNLPLEDQQKLRKEFEKEFKGLPLPWESGYDPGSMDSSNVYLQYLRTPEEQETEEIDTPPETHENETDAEQEERIRATAQSTREEAEASAERIMEAREENQLERQIENERQQQERKDERDQNQAARQAEQQRLDDLGMSGRHQERQEERWAAQEERQDDRKEAQEERWRNQPEWMGNAETTAEERQWERQVDRDTRAAERHHERETESAERVLNRAQRRAARAEMKDDIKGIPTALSTRWASFTEEQKARIVAGTAEASSTEASGGTFGTALGNIQPLVIDAYITYAMELLNIDNMVKVLDRFPGAELVARFVETMMCSHQGLFDPPIKDFLKTLSLNVCGDFGVGLGVPEMAPIPNFFKQGQLLFVVKEKFAVLVEELLTNILMSIILKVLTTIDGALTNLCEAVGNQAENLISGNGKGFDDALREAFCPDASNEELKETQDNLFNSSGMNRPTSPPGADNIEDQTRTDRRARQDTAPGGSAFDCLYKMLNSTLSRREVLSLITNTPDQMDPNLLTRISELTNAFCPQFSQVFGNPDQVADVFCNIGNYVPPEVRRFLQDEIAGEPEGPIFDSICLTNEELEVWNSNRVMLYTTNGLDRPTAEEMVDKANERVLDDLEDLSTILQKSPEGLMKDAFDNIINPADPKCVDLTHPLAQISEGSEDAAGEKESIIKSIFDNVERTFIRDLIGGRNALLNNILRDKNNFRLKKHERRTNRPMIWPNYTDSEKDWEFRKENSNILVSGRMQKIKILNPDPKPLGNYPQTVGTWMRDQLMDSKIKYKSSPSSPQIEFNFKDRPADSVFDFKINYHVEYSEKQQIQLKVTEEFHSRIPPMAAKMLGIAAELFGAEPLKETILDVTTSGAKPWSRYTDFDYQDYQATHPYQSMVFKRMLEKSVDTPINDNGTLVEIFDATNNKIIRSARRSLLKTPDGDIPSGFQFGYGDVAPITFEDLLYVNPKPGSKFYTHPNKDKVLGRSYTENPRVHFLDPAIHGGRYISPNIYIEPAKHTGWLGMVNVFIPEITSCETGDNGFLNVTEITKRVKKLENEIPFDERLSLPSDCRVEIPYDKQMSPAGHGLMEGVVIATNKVYATEMILRTMVLFSSVNFSDKNLDSTLGAMLAQEMKKGMTAQETRWNIIQGYTYYLTFLEQAVQVVQRQIKSGLMEETEELKAAGEILNQAQKNYPVISLVPSAILRKDYKWENFESIFRGAAIIGFGEDWLEDFNIIEPGDVAANIIKLGFLTPFKINLCRKIDTIHHTREAAEVFLGALILKQIKDLIKVMNINMRPRPHIFDIQKYLLSRNGMVLGSSLRSGETIIENPTIEGATGFDYGDIMNVSTGEGQNPFDGFELKLTAENIDIPDEYEDAATYLLGDVNALGSKIKDSLLKFKKGVYYLEKYVRLTQKDGSNQIYNIKEFQNFMRNNPDYESESTISDNFGNAEVIDGKLVGSVGIRFGVRLIFCPPEDWDYEIPVDRAENMRTFKFDKPKVTIRFDDSFDEEPGPSLEGLLPGPTPSVSDLNGTTIEMGIFQRAIPIAVYEANIKDRKIADLNLDDDNLGEDLKCYIDQLVLTKDFKTLFDYCYPIKSFLSFFAAYSYYGFFETIGMNPDNSEEMDEEPSELKEKWKGRIFHKSKKKLRRMFNSTYRTDHDSKKERRERSKLDMAGFLKRLRPNIFLNLDRSTAWWQRRKILDFKPFDPDGKPCMNEFQKMFRG